MRPGSILLGSPSNVDRRIYRAQCVRCGVVRFVAVFRPCINCGGRIEVDCSAAGVTDELLELRCTFRVRLIISKIACGTKAIGTRSTLRTGMICPEHGRDHAELVSMGFYRSHSDGTASRLARRQ